MNTPFFLNWSHSFRNKIFFLVSLISAMSAIFWSSFFTTHPSQANHFLAYLQSSPQNLDENLSASSRLVLGQKINLNRASLDDLKNLPGVGEKRAEEILKFRNTQGKFFSLEELMHVKGIKEKRFSKLKAYLEI